MRTHPRSLGGALLVGVCGGVIGAAVVYLAHYYGRADLFEFSLVWLLGGLPLGILIVFGTALWLFIIRDTGDEAHPFVVASLTALGTCLSLAPLACELGMTRRDAPFLAESSAFFDWCELAIARIEEFHSKHGRFPNSIATIADTIPERPSCSSCSVRYKSTTETFHFRVLLHGRHDALSPGALEWDREQKHWFEP